MWTVATYEATSLFSLRPALSTASGGQTLLVPTPFALKMALLDVAIRGWGRARAESWFPAIRDLDVAIAGPDRLVVIHTFVKILRLKKNGPSDAEGTGIVGPLGRTISFRAFVQFAGPLRIAVRPGTAPEAPAPRRRGKAAPVVAEEEAPLDALFAQINYLGKRGGFLQLQAAPAEVAELAEYPEGEFVRLNGPPAEEFAGDGLLQLLDDCGPGLTFQQADIYDAARIAVGRERVLRPTVLPYRLARSSRGFALYEKL